MLNIDENKSYTLEETGRKLMKNKIVNVKNELSPNCIHDGYATDTQDRLGKDRLGKDNNTISKDIVSSTKVQPIIDSWNSLGLQKLVSINPNTNRYRLLNARIKEYGLDIVLEAIENIRYSSFLKGQNNKNWTITFDWLIKPNNFTKVLEGNYRDKGDSNNGGIEQNIKSSEDKQKYNFGCFE